MGCTPVSSGSEGDRDSHVLYTHHFTDSHNPVRWVLRVPIYTCGNQNAGSSSNTGQRRGSNP